jgi:hypothetical protein
MARAKTLPPLDSEGPPPRHAMRADWTDPDDIRPNSSKAPRKIHGWRTYCPLRRMSGHPASGITERHIMAVDKLREQVDLAVLGYSAERPLIYVAQFPLPRWGLGQSAIEQMRAVRAVRRVMMLFSMPQLVMIEIILLKNASLREWTRRVMPPLHAETEKRKLMVILDRLVEFYKSEIKDDIARGRRLTP